MFAIVNDWFNQSVKKKNNQNFTSLEKHYRTKTLQIPLYIILFTLSNLSL